MEDHKYNPIQVSRLRALFSIQQAAAAMHELYYSEPAPESRKDCLQSVGQLHEMANKMKSRWKVT